MGSPEAAAATFTPVRSAAPAPVGTRLAAAALDNLPLAGLTLALLVSEVVRAAAGGGGFWLTFPPVVSAFGDVCVSLSPLRCAPMSGPLYLVGVPLALAWSIVGLGLLEAWSGTTPAKRLRGLRVVTETGLRVPVPVAIARRLSFLAGPLAWLDWLPVLWGQRRRVADLLAGTKVVVADPARPAVNEAARVRPPTT
nr:RDD family protein [Prauserella shujinwangii]